MALKSIAVTFVMQKEEVETGGRLLEGKYICPLTCHHHSSSSCLPDVKKGEAQKLKKSVELGEMGGRDPLHSPFPMSSNAGGWCDVPRAGPNLPNVSAEHNYLIRRNEHQN